MVRSSTLLASANSIASRTPGAGFDEVNISSNKGVLDERLFF